MSSDYLSRRDSPCLLGKLSQNWRANLPSANSVAQNRSHLLACKASARRTPAGCSRLFQGEQIRSNPSGLNHDFSMGCVKNPPIKPIGLNGRCFNHLGVKRGRFSRFLNATAAISEWPGRTNPIKPIDVILPVFIKISQKSTDQTHGVHLERLQQLTAIFGRYFAIFKCSWSLPTTNWVMR